MENENYYLSKAKEIASLVHYNKTDSYGYPVIAHSVAMAKRMITDDERIVTYLHDVLEDTELTLEMLREWGFSEEVVEAVDCLTKKADDAYNYYIEKIKRNHLARVVKIADLEYNCKMLKQFGISLEVMKKMNLYRNTIEFLRK